MSVSARFTEPVTRLEGIPLEDDQPLVEATPVLIYTEGLADTALVDVGAFISDQTNFFNGEVALIARMNEHLVQGELFLSLLYSYRSLSRAIPQVQQADKWNRAEIYERTYDVLKPEVTKMKQLMAFRDKSITVCRTVLVEMLSEHRKVAKVYPSEEFLLTFARILNMFMVIDALKNMKTSLNNDFAMYKRTLTNMKMSAAIADTETVENQQLYMFLASQDSFSVALKKELNNIPCEEILTDLVNLCCDMYDQKRYLTPENKHVLLKAMAFGLFLLDSDNATDRNNITRNKRIKLERFGKIFKATPVVPLFGDLSTNIVSILKRAAHIDDVRWSYDPADEALRRSYHIIYFLDETRNAYRDYMTELALFIGDMKEAKRAAAAVAAQANAAPVVVPGRNQALYELFLRGLRLLSEWTSRVLEQSAWKFSNPTDSGINPDCPKDAKDYEKVVRYNYSALERSALVEFLTMIKSLSDSLNRAALANMDCIHQHVYNQTMMFVAGPLTEAINNARKKKKPTIGLAIVQQLKDMLRDELPPGPALGAEKSKAKPAPFNFAAAPPSSINVKSVGISRTQWVYMRAMLDLAYSDRAPGMQSGIFKDKDFTNEQAEAMEAFFLESYYYPQMLSFTETVTACADLSEMWYKEFYLELSKEIQFPIEMSLPWILTEHILDTDAPELAESILYPLDLYNDAAHRALHKLKARFLYDEIEAEVNLAFDQFLFKLSQNIYAHFRMRASSIYLNKEYKNQLEDLLAANDGRFDANRAHFDSILRQRHFQLLGRSLDLNRLLGQRMVGHVKKSIDTAIGRFEGSEFTHILELQMLLDVTRLTHLLLSEHVALDPFDDLVAEVDEETSVTTYNGRMITHVVAELVMDVIPNYCFNNTTERFVPTMVSLIDPVQRPHAPKPIPAHMFGGKAFNLAFNAICDTNYGHVGEIHFQAMLRVLGRRYLPVLLGELANNFHQLEARRGAYGSEQLKTGMSQYIAALMRGMPVKTDLPLMAYGIEANYLKFTTLLKPVITYQYLRTEAFQSFRELGNCFTVAYVIDKALRHDDALIAVHVAPLVGLRSAWAGPGSGRRGGAAAEPAIVNRPTVKQSITDANEFLVQQGTATHMAIAQRAEQLYRVGNGQFSMLTSLIKRAREHLGIVENEWRGSVPKNGVVDIEWCLEFYRVWSAVQFSYCTPSINEKEFTAREVFGEGLQWAGCVVMTLLGQRHRFNAFDFSYHMINVARTDPKSPVIGGIDLGKFVENAVFYHAINDEIFDMLDRAIGPMPQPVGEFVPPPADGGDGSYRSYDKEFGTAPRAIAETKVSGAD